MSSVVHSDYKGLFPDDRTAFLSACEVKKPKGKVQRRLVVVGKETLVIVELVTKENRQVAEVKYYIKIKDIIKVSIQPEDVRKGMFRIKKAEETTFLIKSAKSPDIVFNLVHDRRNMAGCCGPNELRGVLTNFYNTNTGKDLDVEEVQKGGGKLAKEAKYARPEGYVKPQDKLASRQQSAGPVQEPEPAEQSQKPTGERPEAEVDTGEEGVGFQSDQEFHESDLSEEGEGRARQATQPQPLQQPPPPGVPPAIWFMCPVIEEASGTYKYNPHLKHNSMPVFDGERGQRLFVASNGHWAAGTADAMKADGCWVEGMQKHNGKMPHEVEGGWAVNQNGAWELQPHTAATASQLHGEGLMHQAAIHKAYRAVEHIAQRFQVLQDEKASSPRHLACDDICNTVNVLLQKVKNDVVSNMQLLQPRREGQTLSELEVAELKQLAARLITAAAEGEEKTNIFEAQLHNSNASFSGAGANSSMASFSGTPGKPPLAPVYASISSKTPDQETTQNKDDQLLWSWTLQASQLTSCGDTILRMTCRADVYTSNHQVLTPCALAITDTGLYLCALVDGKIFHSQPLADIARLIHFSDRRFVGVQLPTLELYIKTEAERTFLHHLLELCPALAPAVPLRLDDHVSDPRLRQLLELDAHLVETLRQELAAKQAEAERWQQQLQHERAKYQQEMDAARAAEDCRLSAAAKGYRQEIGDARCQAELLAAIQQEAEWRARRVDEEATERIEAVVSLVRGAVGEGKRWADWAQGRVQEEEHQLLLASTATVEKSGRARLEGTEGERRAGLAMVMLHPFAYLAARDELLAREATTRCSIMSEWASWAIAAAVKHTGFTAHHAAELHTLLRQEEGRLVVNTTELLGLQEKCGAEEALRVEETNRVGNLLRANKVLQKALSGCRFLDIHRVRLDNIQLKEHTSRRDLEVEALAVCRRLYLAHARSLLAKVLPLKAPAGGGLQARRQEAALKAASSLLEAVIQQSSVMPPATSGLPVEDLWSGDVEGYPAREGWLHKSEGGTTWIHRYFVFENGVFYYVSPTASARRNRLTTIDSVAEVSAVVSLEEQRQPGTKFTSCLWQVRTISEERIILCSPTVADRAAWIADFKRAMAQHAAYTGGELKKAGKARRQRAAQNPKAPLEQDRLPLWMVPSPCSAGVWEDDGDCEEYEEDEEDGASEGDTGGPYPTRERGMSAVWQPEGRLKIDVDRL